MRIMFFMVVIMILLPVILFGMEFYLCKKKSKAALVLPIVTACFFVLFGFYALGLSGILFGIYFVMKHLDTAKESKRTELDKMNIQDLG